MLFPTALQVYAENIWERFPEEFLALGCPHLEDAFDLSAEGNFKHRIVDANNARIVKIFLPCRVEKVETNLSDIAEEYNFSSESYRQGCETLNIEVALQVEDISRRLNALELYCPDLQAEAEEEYLSESRICSIEENVDAKSTAQHEGDKCLELEVVSVPSSETKPLPRRKRRGSQSGQGGLGRALQKDSHLHEDTKGAVEVEKESSPGLGCGNIVQADSKHLTISPFPSPLSSSPPSPVSTPRSDAKSESSAASSMSALALKRGFHIQKFDESSHPFQSSVKIKAKARSLESDEAISPGTLLLLAARQRQAMRSQNRGQ